MYVYIKNTKKDIYCGDTISKYSSYWRRREISLSFSEFYYLYLLYKGGTSSFKLL